MLRRRRGEEGKYASGGKALITADCVESSPVGTVAAGRIGHAVLRRLTVRYEAALTDRHRPPADVKKELSLTFHSKVESVVKICDGVNINAPLHPDTEHIFNGKMKRGAYVVNTVEASFATAR